MQTIYPLHSHRLAYFSFYKSEALDLAKKFQFSIADGRKGGPNKRNPKAMDEREFRRLLDLFPIVRSRNYCADSELSRGSTSHSPKDEVAEWKNAWNEMDERDVSEGTDSEGAFWQKLRLAAEKKVGPAKAEQFCKAFQKAHEKLVYKELSLDAAKKFMNAEGK